MSIKDSNTTIKYLRLIIKDGRVTVCNHIKHPDDGNFYIDLALQVAQDGRYEYPIFASRVQLNDWHDLGAALNTAFVKHPYNTIRSSNTFSLKMSTLNKTPTAHIRIGCEYDRWIRIPFKLGQALLGSEYVHQTWSKRDAYISDMKYLDYFDLVVKDPEE